MNRGIITISESGMVCMPTAPVWMSMQEIADMLNVFGCYVRKAIKAIFKEGILREYDVHRHMKEDNRISYDVFNLELIIAVAFRIDSIESRAFREFIMQAIIKKADQPLEVGLPVVKESNGIEQPSSNVPWRLCASSHLGEPPQCVLAWY